MKVKIKISLKLLLFLMKEIGILYSSLGMSLDMLLLVEFYQDNKYKIAQKIEKAAIQGKQEISLSLNVSTMKAIVDYFSFAELSEDKIFEIRQLLSIMDIAVVNNVTKIKRIG